MKLTSKGILIDTHYWIFMIEIVTPFPMQASIRTHIQFISNTHVCVNTHAFYIFVHTHSQTDSQTHTHTHTHTCTGTHTRIHKQAQMHT